MKFRTAFSVIFVLNALVWIALLALIWSASGTLHSALPIMLAALAFLLWPVGCWLLLRKIGRDAQHLLTGMKALSAGRLERRAEADGSEFTLAVGTLRQRMADVVIKVRNGTAGFALTSGLLSTDNKALQTRTEKQRALLEETAIATGQITGTVKQNAANAEKANLLIASAADAARQGGAEVANVDATMTAIRESSRKIADIISVIDGIAFQTNILAL